MCNVHTQYKRATYIRELQQTDLNWKVVYYTVVSHCTKGEEEEEGSVGGHCCLYFYKRDNCDHFFTVNRLLFLHIIKITKWEENTGFRCHKKHCTGKKSNALLLILILFACHLLKFFWISWNMDYIIIVFWFRNRVLLICLWASVVGHLS